MLNVFPLRGCLHPGPRQKERKRHFSPGVTADEDIIEQPRLIIDIALTRRLLITPGYFFIYFYFEGAWIEEEVGGGDTRDWQLIYSERAGSRGLTSVECSNVENHLSGGGVTSYGTWPTLRGVRLLRQTRGRNWFFLHKCPTRPLHGAATAVTLQFPTFSKELQYSRRSII